MTDKKQVKKPLYKKTWFQVIALGVLFGIVFILVDSYANGKKKNTEIYDGPIAIEKDKTYFTTIEVPATSYDFGAAN